MENLVIRRSTPEDFDQIHEIYAKIFQKPVEVVLKGAKEDCFVAELEGVVVGFVVGYGLRGSFGVEKSAWLAMVGVEPKYMGQKIGKRLAEKVLSHYKEQGYTSVYVSVQWDSTDLLSFFKTLGFGRSKFIHLEKSLEE